MRLLKQRRIRRLLADGFERIATGDYRRAAASFDDALRLDRAYVTFYLNDAVKRSPHDAEVLFRRGMVTRSIEDLSQAVILDPKHKLAFLQRGIARQLIHGDIEGALSDYDAALKLDPDWLDAIVFRKTALVAKQKKEPEPPVGSKAALYRFAEGLQIDSAKSLAVGGEDAFVKHLEKLSRAYFLILHEYPEDKIALLRLHRVALLVSFRLGEGAIQELEKARRRYEEEWKQGPKSPEPCILLCRIENMIHGMENDRGREWIDRAMRLDPNDSDAHLEMARSHARRKDAVNAERMLARAFDLNPRNPDVLAERAMAFGRKGDLGRAIAESRRCLEIDDQNLCCQMVVLTELAKEIQASSPAEIRNVQRLLDVLGASKPD